jgi:hypothetical protein
MKGAGSRVFVAIEPAIERGLGARTTQVQTLSIAHLLHTRLEVNNKARTARIRRVIGDPSRYIQERIFRRDSAFELRLQVDGYQLV